MPSMPRPYKKMTKIAYDLIGMPVNYSDSHGNKQREGSSKSKAQDGDRIRDEMFSKIIQNSRQGNPTRGY